MSLKSEFYKAGDAFLKSLILSMESAELDLPRNWDIDHLCFRTNSLESYQARCKEISNYGKLLAESDVAGRPISTFKLYKAFESHGHIIDVVEVPAPKGSASYEDGFEHVEIVVDTPFSDVKAMLAEAKIASSESIKPLNSELKISLAGGNIKFHHMSLESLIRLELSPAFAILESSQALNTLGEFDPVVAGAFPLGVATADSALSLAVSFTDKQHFLQVLQKNFASHPEFSIREDIINDVAAVICRFRFLDIPFEITGQEIPSAQQPQVRHLQIEERLLKLGGDTLLHKVQHRKARGLTTEQAFADALGTKGDPVESLLALQTLSSAEVAALTM